MYQTLSSARDAGKIGFVAETARDAFVKDLCMCVYIYIYVDVYIHVYIHI